jgi:DnaK suppressor protein
MTKTELNTFRTALQNRQAELGNGTRNREALAIETSPEELDRIQHAGDREWAMRSLERNSNGLREVRAALQRIDAGTFGICTDCDESINPKRLAAAPGLQPASSAKRLRIAGKTRLRARSIQRSSWQLEKRSSMILLVGGEFQNNTCSGTGTGGNYALDNCRPVFDSMASGI